VTGVAKFDDPAPGGYHINFTKSQPVTIMNGEKGETGDTPQISVKEDPDGVYYWWLNDDWLLNDNGDKIPVTGEKGEDGTPGITPKLRINATANEWEMCTTGECDPDTGDWEPMGIPATGEQGDQGDAIFAKDGIDNTHDEYVEFTLADGTTKIQLPKYVPLGITFEQPPLFGWGGTKKVGFTTTGNVTSVKVVGAAGWTVAVALSGNAGTFTITAPMADVPAFEAGVLVSDDAGYTVMRPLELRATGTPEFAASTQTWTFGSQIWSDAITATGCEGMEVNVPGCISYTADEQIYNDPEYFQFPGGTFYYYNWHYVDQYHDVLCPSPWRVPTVEDFITLKKNTDTYQLSHAWELGGAWVSGSPLRAGFESFMRALSSERYPGVNMFLLGRSPYWGLLVTEGDYYVDGIDSGKLPGDLDGKDSRGGGQVRCVKSMFAYEPPAAPNIEFEQPDAFALGDEPRDITLTTVTVAVRSITTVDVPRGWTITPDLANRRITVTPPTDDAKYYAAAGTATLLVSDGNTQTITKPLALTCNTAYEPPAAPDIEFKQPGAFELGETRAITLDVVTSTVRSITPVDVPLGWTVIGKTKGGKPTPPDSPVTIQVISPNDDGKYYTAAGTATLLVSDGNTQTISKPLVLSCPPYTPPEKLGMTFEQPGVFLWSDTKTVGFTTTGNATTVKVLDVPAGWTVAVTKSGAAGTFTITAPAYESGGEAIVLAADAAGNTAMRTLELACLAAASTQTWTFGESPLVWSDAIQIPECDKDDYDNHDTEPRCRSYMSDKLRYYYNWSYVNTNAATLCPSPWRVPSSSSDFSALVGATDRSTLINEWGYGGYARGSSMENVSSRAYYWSSTDSGNTAYYLLYYSDNLYVNYTSKVLGHQVRCVK
jgi:hypothetical protein